MKRIKELNVDGTPVSHSVLSQPRSIKAAPCGVLLKVNADNLKESLKQYKNAKFNGAFGGLKISGIRDLSFLADFPDMLYLEVDNEKPTKASYLEPLRNLRGLAFSKASSGIDFSWFPELEMFFGIWHKEHVNIQQCRLLHHLYIRNFNSDDLTPLANCRRLDWLEIVRSTITSLNGIETLEDLRCLDIAYMTKLKSLDALKHDEPQLRRLCIESAKNIESYDPIASQSYLNHLSLFNCPDIKNLKWTAGLNRLEHFSFVETNVKDGNLKPLLELARLRYIGCEDKRHYSHKMHEFIDLLAQR